MELYSERLKKGIPICLGLDPDLNRIPAKGNIQKRIENFLIPLCKKSSGLIDTVKPNYAFFAQYGFPGLRALKTTISSCKKLKYIVILDAKRGDIGKTSQAYAKEVFDFWEADAVTVSAYLGYDTLLAYLPYLLKGKGIYVLARTSNPGAKDIQDAIIGNSKVYENVLRKASELKIGAVVGATYPNDLKYAASLGIPLLIPGIGSQGGSIKETWQSISKNKIHRISSSSSVLYAYENTKIKPLTASIQKLKEMRDSL